MYYDYDWIIVPIVGHLIGVMCSDITLTCFMTK